MKKQVKKKVQSITKSSKLPTLTKNQMGKVKGGNDSNVVTVDVIDI